VTSACTRSCGPDLLSEVPEHRYAERTESTRRRRPTTARPSRSSEVVIGGRDGGGEDVPVIAVGKLEPVDETFVAADHCVGHGDCHQPAGAAKPIRRQVGSIVDDVVEALIQDPFRPARLEEAGDGKADQKIPQPSGVQDVRVEHRNKQRRSQ